MGQDHLITLMILFAVAALPVLAWWLWRMVKLHQLRKAASEMRRGNEIYGEWKRRGQHSDSSPARSPPKRS